MSTATPADRGRFRIALVCLGNICRSPMAQVVLESRVRDAGLADRVEIDSAGTGTWHLGEPMDPRAARALADRGYAGEPHRARRFDASWYEAHDLVLALDAKNFADLAAAAPGPGDRAKLAMFRDFDPRPDERGEVPDPWFGGEDGFDDVLEIIERTADSLVARLPDLITRR